MLFYYPLIVKVREAIIKYNSIISNAIYYERKLKNICIVIGKVHNFRYFLMLMKSSKKKGKLTKKQKHHERVVCKRNERIYREIAGSTRQIFPIPVLLFDRFQSCSLSINTIVSFCVCMLE